MAVPKDSTKPTQARRPEAASTLAAAMIAPPVDELAGSVRITADATPPFHLVHSPEAWEVCAIDGEVEGEKVSGHVLLPVLTRLLEVPGSTAGMRTRRTNEAPEAGFADAIDRRRRAGWAVLDRNERIASVYLPPGVPEGPYIRRIACADATGNNVGWRYEEAWNVPVPVAPGRKQAFRFHHASFALWRASLVMRGIIAAPLEDAVAPLLRLANERVRRLEVAALPDDVRKLRVAKARELAESVQGAASAIGAA